MTGITNSSPGLAWWIDNNPEEAAEFIATIPQRRVGDCEQDIGRFPNETIQQQRR